MDPAPVEVARERQDQLVAGPEVEVERARHPRRLAKLALRRDHGGCERVGADRGGHIVAAVGDFLAFDIGVGKAEARHHPQPAAEKAVRKLDLAIRQQRRIEAAFLRPGIAPLPQIGARRAAQLHAEQPALAVEGALGADVDRSRRRIGIDVGADRFRNLDRIDTGERDAFETEHARRTRAGIGIGRGHAGAVERHLRIVRRHAAQRNADRGAVRAVGVDARHEFQEFGRVAVGDIAIGFGRQIILDIHRFALVHDRARIAFEDAGDHDDILRALRPRADQLDVVACRGAGGDVDRFDMIAVTRIADGDARRARRDVDHPIFAALARIGRAAAAIGGLDADDRVAQIFARRGVEHAAGDDALTRGALFAGPGRARSGRACRTVRRGPGAQDDDAARVRYDFEARAHQQLAQCVARRHLSDDRPRLDMFEAGGGRHDLKPRLASEGRDRRRKALRRNVEADRLRRRRRRNCECGNGDAAAQYRPQIHVNAPELVASAMVRGLDDVQRSFRHRRRKKTSIAMEGRALLRRMSARRGYPD